VPCLVFFISFGDKIPATRSVPSSLSHFDLIEFLPFCSMAFGVNSDRDFRIPTLSVRLVSSAGC
jgi:hypothetical protein